MKLTLSDLIRSNSIVDFTDLLNAWKWLIPEIKAGIFVSNLGDLFFVDGSNKVCWLQTDCGIITTVANDLGEFNTLLQQEENIEIWFSPQLIENFLEAGITLKDNEVYSCRNPPVLGGDYSLSNIMATDLSVHFEFAGQICEQIRDLPDGTEVNIGVKL